MTRQYYCPNCDREVDQEGNTAKCDPCGMTWVGPYERWLPTTPIGQDARDQSFRRVWKRQP